MKKQHFIAILIIAFCWSCNNNEVAEKKEQVIDSTKVDSITTTTDKQPTIEGDSVLLDITKEMLNALDQNNLTEFANHIHPTMGIRFSPYGFIDTAQDKKLTRDQFLSLLKSKKKIKWGMHDGSGEDINLDLPGYIKKFVYDVKFVNPENLNLNQTLAKGNSLNNQSTVYPGLPYTESYFSGFEKKYDGMDWRSLRLIYKKEGDQYFLVGVIHDQWTI